MREKELFKEVIEHNLISKEYVKNQAMRPRPIRNGGRIAFAVCMAIIVIMIVISSIYVNPDDIDINPKQLKSYSEVNNIIDSYHNLYNSFSLRNFFQMLSPILSSPKMEAPTSDARGDYSKTNVQTEGVDEADIVKVDANYIYKLNSRGCVIVEVDNGEINVVSVIEIADYLPIELYLVENMLIIIGGVYTEYNYYYDEGIPGYRWSDYMYYEKTDIRFYDITDRSNPIAIRQVTIDGNYYTSRILEDTNELVYIVNYNFYYGQQNKYIPHINDSYYETEMPIPEENIYYYEGIPAYGYTIIGKLSLDNPQEESDIKAYLGLTGTVYVSNDNLYIASYHYRSNYKVNIWGWVTYNSSKPETRIVRISLSDLSHKAAAIIEGTVKDRYSLDEYNNHLRIAISVGAEYSRVYVLDMNLETVGKTNEIAPGEMIYAVRFNGDTGSLVTFELVDPYFNLDLSDPANPIVSEGLKEDGVSYYIHYLKDTSYTIGVGRNSMVNQWGGVRWLEIKVSLYDNSSGEADNIKNYFLPYGYVINPINDNIYSHAEIFYDPRALLVNEDRGLFAFSYLVRINDINYQGLAVFKIDTDAINPSDILTYQGLLSNHTNGVYSFSYYDYQEMFDSYSLNVERGVQIGDYIYTLSDRLIVSYHIDTLQEISRLDLSQTDTSSD